TPGPFKLPKRLFTLPFAPGRECGDGGGKLWMATAHQAFRRVDRHPRIVHCPQDFLQILAALHVSLDWLARIEAAEEFAAVAQLLQGFPECMKLIVLEFADRAAALL